MTLLRTSPPVPSRPAQFVLAAALFALVAAASAAPEATDGIATPIESDVVEAFEFEDVEFDDFAGADATGDSRAASPARDRASRVAEWRHGRRRGARIDARARAIPPPALG